MRTRIFALAFLLAPLAASAQFGNPGFMAPETQFNSAGVPAPNQSNATDKLFTQLFAEGGLAEVEFGELASGRVQSDSVREFARMMVADHTAANDGLADLARDRRLILPERLNLEHVSKRAELDALRGTDFDHAYMRAQVIDHQKAAELLLWELGSGQDAELQRFAADTLPTVLAHLERARQIVAELTQTALER